MADIRITPAASVMAFTSSLSFKETFTQSASGSITLYGSGSTGRTNLFAVDGNNGRLFSIDDDLSNSLFSVNTIAGLPVIEAFADNTVNIGKYGAYSFQALGNGNAGIGSGSVMFVSASGNVGIGTTNPGYKFEVIGSSLTTGAIRIAGTEPFYFNSYGGGWYMSDSTWIRGYGGKSLWMDSGYIGGEGGLTIGYGGATPPAGGAIIAGNVGIGTTSPVVITNYKTLTFDATSGTFTEYRQAGTALLRIGVDGSRPFFYGMTSANMDFYTNTALRMTITAAGNVGIGTSSPYAGTNVTSLNVNATAYPVLALSVGGTFVGAVSGYSDHTTLYAKSGNYITLDSNDTERMRITSAGDVGIGTTSPQAVTSAWTTLEVQGKSAGGGGIIYTANNGASVKSHFYSDSTSGYIGTQTNHFFGFTTNNAERMRITAAGNVGIGITNPANKLVAVSDATYNGENTYAIAAAAASDPAYKTIIGYDYVNDIGVIAAVRTSVGWKNISIPQGSVGIGTTNPIQVLQVAGNIALGSTSVGYSEAGSKYIGSSYTSPGTDGFSGLQIESVNAPAPYNGNYSQNIKFYAHHYGTGAGGTPRLTIQYDGNVGIGTTSPGTRLDVRYDDGVTSGEHNVLASFSRSGTGPLVIGYRADGTSVSSALIRVGDSLPLTIGTTSANQAFTLLNSGNVGIGTTNPTYRLEAHNNATANAALLYSSTSATTVAIGSTSNSNNANVIWYTDSGTGQIFRGGTGFSAWAGALSLNIYNSNGPIGFHPGATANALYLTTGGLVGIGITTPQAPLSFVNSAGNKIDFYHSTVSTGDRYGIQVQSDQLIIHSGAAGLSTGGILLGKSTTSTFTEAMRITNGGNVGIGTTNPAYKCEVSDGTRTAIINPNASIDGIFLGVKQAKPLVFGTTDTERMRITSAGLVGIGTTNVIATLTVRTAANSVVGISDNSGIPKIGGYLDNGTLDELQIDSKLLYISNDNDTTMAISGSKVLIGLASTVLTNKLVVQGDIWCTGITGSIITPGLDTQVLYKNGTSLAGAPGLVYSSGNVGIGSTSPGTKLVVAGSDDAAAQGVVEIQTAGGTNLKLGGDTSYSWIQSHAAKPLYINQLGNNVILNSGGGSVGIGTTSVSGKLSIYGADTVVTLTNTNASGYGEFHFYEGATLKTDLFVVGSSLSTYAGANSFNIYQNANAPIAFYTNGTNERMRITGAGNVGIGTTNPATKLDVVGTNVRTDKAFISQGSNLSWTGGACFIDYISASSYGRVGAYNYAASEWENLYIGGGGKIGIGTTTFTYRVNILGDMYITGGSIGVGVAPNATDGRIDASNDIVAYSTSDIRFKENIQRIPNALEKVNTLSGNTFTWKPDPELTKLHGFEGNDVGIIAQEIEAILPDIVTTRDSGYKAVKYEKLVPLLIEAIKELTDKVNKLENK